MRSHILTSTTLICSLLSPLCLPTGCATNSTIHNTETNAPHPNSEIPNSTPDQSNQAANLCLSNDVYSLNVDLANGLVEVEAVLTDLEKNEILCLPAFGQRFAEHFKLISIQTSDKTPLPAAFSERGCTQISSDAEKLIFQYTLSLDELDQGHIWIASSLSPYRNKKVLSFPGESLFIERNSSSPLCSEIFISEINGKSAFSTLNEVNNSKTDTKSPTFSSTSDSENWVFEQARDNIKEYNFNSKQINRIFFASNNFELLRSYFVFGELNQLKTTSNKSSISIFLDDNLSPYAQIFSREILSILDYYQTLMPSKAPDSVRIFIFSSQHDAQQVSGFARPHGIILQLGSIVPTLTVKHRLLLAHELFHLYNGEQLHFQVNALKQTAWFREGMTQYIALNSLKSLSLINDAQFKEQLSEITTQISNSTNNESTNDGENTSNPYHIGFFLAWLIDLQWMNQKTPYSLTDFWSYLARQTDWNSEKSVAWLKTHLETYSQFDFSDFFKRYVENNTPIPYRQILTNSGYKLKRHEQTSFDIGMSSQFDPQIAQYRVKTVIPGSFADQAGFRPQQTFVPVPTTNWKSSEDKQLIRQIAPGHYQTIRLPVHHVSQNAIMIF